MDVLEIPVLIFRDFISCFITEAFKVCIYLLEVFVYRPSVGRGQISVFLYRPNLFRRNA
jgi:hypothetical protein